MEEQALYTKYTLLSFSEYFKLNKAISEALGYNLSYDTARYTDPIPKLAQVGETTLAVMQIDIEVQEKLPELLEGLTLVDEYTPVDNTDTIEATGLNTEQIDYTLNHIAAVNHSIELIQLESEPRSEESDIAVEKLVSENVTVITVL